jgi:UDP-glucose 4-epimerase
VTRILVTGGAGYIGSHTVRQLLDAGFDPVVIDDLSAGHKAAVPCRVPLIVADLADEETLREVIKTHRPAAAVHFAGAIEPSESMTDPRRFYRANLANGIKVADALVDLGPIPLVFSSTCAIFGEPARVPVAEDDPKQPVSVYGESKLAFEQVLRAYDAAYGLRSVSLRYFNACGARADATLGDDHRLKIHLVTVALLAALGQRPDVKIFGSDYPTPDGTCIRDYVHVDDLASAHLRAVEWLLAGGDSEAFNLGTGRGFSVLEIVEAAERVTGRRIKRAVAARRAGDPAALYAASAKAATLLGWKPAYGDLEEIIETAWRWHLDHPAGFDDE